MRAGGRGRNLLAQAGKRQRGTRMEPKEQNYGITGEPEATERQAGREPVEPYIAGDDHAGQDRTGYEAIGDEGVGHGAVAMGAREERRGRCSRT